MSGTDYLLDTSVVIGLLKRRPEAVSLMDEYSFEFPNAAISQITRMELLSRADLPEEEKAEVEEFLMDCVVIPLDELIEREAITMRREKGLKLPDAIIAATARVSGLRLIPLDARLARAVEGR